MIAEKERTAVLVKDLERSIKIKEKKIKQVNKIVINSMAHVG